MVRKVLIGLLIAVVCLGPGIGLSALAVLFAPAMTDAATCATTGTDAGGLSDPSLPVSGTVPQSLTATTADGETVTLNHTQLERAATIIAVGNSENIPANGQVIALMAALTESTLRVLANPTAVPQSVNYPNDGDGSDHDSLGLFQMRPSTGWGSVANLMDPVWSSRAFYGGPDGPNHGSPAGLLDVPNWQNLSLGAAAQAVEVSQYPDRYANYQPALTPVDGRSPCSARCRRATCPTRGRATKHGPLPCRFTSTSARWPDDRPPDSRRPAHAVAVGSA